MFFNLWKDRHKISHINQWKQYPFSVPAFLKSSSVRSVESVAEAGLQHMMY